MTIGSLPTLGVVCALGLTVELSTVISAIIVSQSNIGGSLKRAFEQGIGSFLGAAHAAVMALVIMPDNPVSTALALVLALAPLTVPAAFSVWFQVAPVTAAAVILGSPGLEIGADILAVERVLGVAIGCAVSLVTGLVGLPARASRSAVETVARVSVLLAARLRAIAPDREPGRTTSPSGPERSEKACSSGRPAPPRPRGSGA